MDAGCAAHVLDAFAPVASLSFLILALGVLAGLLIGRRL